MKLKLPQLLAAVMFPALPVQATPELMDATCTATGQYQQGAPVGVGVAAAAPSDVVVGKLTNIALTAKELIRFAGEENETTYPTGSKLLVDLGYFKSTISGTSGSSSTVARVWVVDKNGLRLADVTQYICVSFDFGSLIYSGKIDLVTDQEDTRNRFAAKMHLRFPSKGILMTFRGNCTELYKLSAPNNSGDRRERGNVIFTGDGSGYFDERLWVGKIVAHFVGNSIIKPD